MATAVMLAVSTTVHAQLGDLIRKATNTVSNVSGTVSEIEYSVGQATHVAGKVKEAKDAVMPNKNANEQTDNTQQAPATNSNQEIRIKTDASSVRRLPQQQPPPPRRFPPQHAQLLRLPLQPLAQQSQGRLLRPASHSMAAALPPPSSRKTWTSITTAGA